MAATARATPSDRPHIPVLLGPLLRAVAPVEGRWLDGTFGAGGYARGLLEAGAARVIGVDRDPLAFAHGDRLGGRLWRPAAAGRRARSPSLTHMRPGRWTAWCWILACPRCRLDQAERGFSFMKDGPLDMRMSQDGPVGRRPRQHRRGGRAGRHPVPLRRGARLAPHRAGHRRGPREAPDHHARCELAEIVASCLPRPKPGQSHPATRSFQAIRIAVNDEFGELAAGLAAAERALKPGGLLAVVTFHSLEDRIVKRFFQTALRRGRRRTPTAMPPPTAERGAPLRRW